MPEVLHDWHAFYLLLGTSAAALTGLMFVVVSISPQTIAERPQSGVRAFVTPTLVFFTTVLVVSALMLAPGLTPIWLAALLALVGFGGLVYLFWVGGYERGRENPLEREDWIFYIAAPFVGYILLFAAAVAIGFNSLVGAAVLAVTMVLLLIIGIHNTWDLVTGFAQRRAK
jgi:hypothetical protein